MVVFDLNKRLFADMDPGSESESLDHQPGAIAVSQPVRHESYGAVHCVHSRPWKTLDVCDEDMDQQSGE